MSIPRIPKLFFQTSKLPLEPYLIKMTTNMLGPEWKYLHFLDSDIIYFLETNPIPEFPNSVQFFQSLKRGEHKADFFRYYFLFVKGGVFMDSDAMIYKPINDVVKDYTFFSVNSSLVPDGLFQGILAAAPGNPVIYKALKSFFHMDVVLLNTDYHMLCKDLFRFYHECTEKDGYYLYNEVPDMEGDRIVNDEGVLFFRHYWRNKEGIPNTIKSAMLVYCCVFYNNDYFKLLELLLKSMKMYSNLESFDFLVMTTNEFEPIVKALSKKLQLDIRIWTVDLTTIFQAACARLRIFDYPELEGYERLLYIDTDIIIKGDLTPIFKLDMEDVLHGIESGTIEANNFGAQFFDFNTIDKHKTGLNSGTLLFRNSPRMQALFFRIRNHIEEYTESGAPPPYCLDQPFINYHAIKDSLYDNQLLNPHVSLFEGNDTVNNYNTSSICHFSYPIGNFGHKYQRMSEFLNKTLYREVNTKVTPQVIGNKYSWNTGYIKFFINPEAYLKIDTAWGEGNFKGIDTHTFQVCWNNCWHVLKFNNDYTKYYSIRTEPRDFQITYGSLIDSLLYIYGDSHAALSFNNLSLENRNLFEYARTMYRVGRDGQIVNFSPSHNSKNRIFCLAYGEVDVRGHIGKQVHYGRHHENICNDLVNSYFVTIKKSITEYKAIIIVGISPPTAIKDHMTCMGHSAEKLPFIGTDLDRVIYTQYMNELLEKKSLEYGYTYFNPYQFYTRSDGTLNYDLSDKCIHIGNNQYFLDEFYKCVEKLT